MGLQGSCGKKIQNSMWGKKIQSGVGRFKVGLGGFKVGLEDSKWG